MHSDDLLCVNGNVKRGAKCCNEIQFTLVLYCGLPYEKQTTAAKAWTTSVYIMFYTNSGETHN